MAVKIRFPINTFLETFSNFRAWNIAFLKKYLQETEEQVEVIAETEFAELFNATVTELETDWRNYIAHTPTGAASIVSEVVNMVQGIFRTTLDRILGRVE